MVFSFVMAIGIFMVLPLFIANICRGFIHSDTVMAILEGVIRIVIFIAYIKLVSRMEDIREDLCTTVRSTSALTASSTGWSYSGQWAGKFKEHKRCGTSFIMIVMIISILFLW